jgi:pimeloyl-ACP methyl ester carboxylesterase
MNINKLLSTIILLLFFVSQNIFSQNIIKSWEGILDIGNGTKLRVIIHILKGENGKLSALLDSPDQGAKGIKAENVSFENGKINFQIPSIGGTYDGIVDENFSRIDGEWKQAGTSFPLILKKAEKVEEIKRPQEPQKPFPYNEEEVTFKNEEAGITLAGTFTYPKKGTSFPAVVLVSGSGPQNRDEEVFGHKPFLIWSDYLTRNGIAVLRYDDRGIGKSTGIFSGATTADFVTDAISAVEYLKTRKEIIPDKIGIAGHSEGGIIAPIAANKCNDVSFIVLGAGTAVPGNEILLLQIEAISKLAGESEERIKREYDLNKKTFEILKSRNDSTEVTKKINVLYQEYLNNLPDSEKSRPENSTAAIEQREKSFSSNWMRYFLRYDPRTELQKLRVPVLAIFGEKDIQVSPSQNKAEMEKALQKSESGNYKVVVLPGLNHIFQECETGAINEYPKIEQTTSPKMLELMTLWIKKITI